MNSKTKSIVIVLGLTLGGVLGQQLGVSTGGVKEILDITMTATLALFFYTRD